MLVRRSKNNPILVPINEHVWEAEAAFNGCPVLKDGKIFLVYRALSQPHYHSLANTRLQVSDVGIAESDDGESFTNRRKFIAPEHTWERYGCEDPRITKFEGSYYIFYTAMSTYPFSAEGIKVGLAISDDLISIKKKGLVTPFNAKAMVMFPERIDGQIHAILTVDTDKPPSKICVASFDNLEDIWLEDKWTRWYKDISSHELLIEHRPMDHIEVGAPPIKTEHGWLLFYSYIRNYFTGKPLFTIEALLLDLNNPRKVISRVRKPLLVPEEYYEKYGNVPNIVFPSGALIRNDQIYLYYGTTDTTCSLAHIPLTKFLKSLVSEDHKSFKLERSAENPILTPKTENIWEAKAVFNPAAIYLDGKVHILYRSMSEDNTSTIGYATSKDGIHIDYRGSSPVYIPREEFEQKFVPNGNSGCEDPRLTVLEGKVYMLYTAYNGKNPPAVAMTHLKIEDFLAQKWHWSRPIIISPPQLDDKDAAIFPERINGKYVIIHRLGTGMDISFHDDLEFNRGQHLEEHKWIPARKGMWDCVKVGLSSTPMKIKEGWLVLYHGVSEDGVYRVGAVLTDHKDVTRIIHRTDEPIFEPETDYERVGIVNNVAFPCGSVIIDDTLFVYYGGADKVTGVATIKLDKILKLFDREN